MKTYSCEWAPTNWDTAMETSNFEDVGAELPLAGDSTDHFFRLDRGQSILVNAAALF